MDNIHIKIKKIDETWLHVDSDSTTVLYNLSDFFSFYAPGYRFNDKYKYSNWDGKIRLFSQYTGKLYVGLLPYLLKWCEDNKYVIINMNKNINNATCFTEQNAKDFINTLILTNGYGDLIKPYDEQLKAFITAVKNGRRTILSPTASGKSLIIYILCRWYLSLLEDINEKILIIVPTVGLVKQLYNDFSDYSLNDSGFHESQVHQIMSGKNKTSFESQIYCSTWQSLQKVDKNYFDQFKVVICDEVHGAKAKSLMSIMEQCTNTIARFGLTGTLDNVVSNKLTIEGLFGIAEKITTTSELMDQGKVSKLDIKMIQLKHPHDICNQCKKWSYQEELKEIVTSVKRNTAIAKLISSRQGNSLTLIQNVKHGELLYDLCIKANKYLNVNKQVYFINGKTSADERERIRKLLDKHDNIDIIATYGVFSTGMNAPNIHHVIFGSPSKSAIRVLQSIGRGLRKHISKKITKLYDIVDDMQYKKKVNYALKHALVRVKLYNKEKFNVDLKGYTI